MSKELKEKGLIPCLITTDKDKRGVFMAYINEEDAMKESIPANDIRMCVYWSSDMHGVLGLASKGPSSSCRISYAAKKGIIHGVTAVFEISEEAEKRWLDEPWG